jgi:hypothetical protein
MTSQYAKISVLDPIAPALERVKTILFKPFDLGKWFVIGFCAWLAYLGKGGGGGGNGFNFRHDVKLNQAIEQARHFIIENLVWIVPVAILVVMLIIVLWLVLTWLSSRGRFMFLHCVAENKAEVKNPWTKFRQHANSLFLFRIVLGLISFFAVALPILLGLVALIAAFSVVPRISFILGRVTLALVLFVVSIVLLLISKFTTDFVVPIMFLRTTSCTAGWREFLTLLSANKAHFVLYILFQIVIGMCICVILFAVMCLTCCCACCILLIPYIGTVLLLPIFVFKLAYSLCYLRQFGPPFDVFGDETA